MGLRKCAKHYLVRSSSVPQDIPCEACGAAILAKPSLVVADPFPENENEIMHQFIGHGVNYLERMWIDTGRSPLSLSLYIFLSVLVPLSTYTLLCALY